jgi:hypothetical protein
MADGQEDPSQKIKRMEPVMPSIITEGNIFEKKLSTKFVITQKILTYCNL